MSEPDIISAIAIKTADNPPSPLKAAIICGSAVIFTFRPLYIPIVPPISIAPIIQVIELIVDIVPKIAIIIPVMPIIFPQYAVRGEDNPRMASINKIPAIKEHKKRKLDGIIWTPFSSF